MRWLLDRVRRILSVPGAPASGARVQARTRSRQALGGAGSANDSSGLSQAETTRSGPPCTAPAAGLGGWLYPTILLLALLSVAADALGAEFSLLPDGRSKLQRCHDRCEREHGPAPSASPAPTRSPAPTVVVDCTDGTISGTATRRTYEPGRVYNLCLNVPADAKAPAGILQIDSVNHANASCNLYQLVLTRPDGVVLSYLPVVAPIARPNFMRGRWGVTVRLDPDDARCANNPGLSLWAYCF